MGIQMAVSYGAVKSHDKWGEARNRNECASTKVFFHFSSWRSCLGFCEANGPCYQSAWSHSFKTALFGMDTRTTTSSVRLRCTSGSGHASTAAATARPPTAITNIHPATPVRGVGWHEATPMGGPARNHERLTSHDFDYHIKRNDANLSTSIVFYLFHFERIQLSDQIILYRKVLYEFSTYKLYNIGYICRGQCSAFII